MKNKLHLTTTNLGDLIYELYEQAAKESKNPIVQRVLVYAALKDLLSNQYRKQMNEAA